MTIQEALNLGLQHQRAGRLAEADHVCRQILAQHPHQPDVLYLLGLVNHQAGRYDVAAQAIGRAAQLRPNQPEFHGSLGATLRELGRWDESIACFERVLVLSPDSASAFSDLGTVLFGGKRFEPAADCFRRALELAPNLPGGHFNLGNCLAALGRMEQSADAYRRCINLQPTLPEAHENLGCVLHNLGRFDEAIASFRTAISLNPRCASAHSNLGQVLVRSGRHEEAIQPFEKALALKPDHPIIHWNYGLALLTLGDFEKGWDEFEWRLRVPHIRIGRGFAQRQWDGSDLEGQTLLLHAEGGFGDAIQYIRYLPMLAGRARRLILECKQPLISLLERIDGIDEVIPLGQPLPEFDLHCPLPSLPRIFRTRLDTIPNSVPYLTIPPDRLELWAARVPRDGARNVGLVWAGGIREGTDHRPPSLQAFAPLAKIKGVRLFNLQLGQGAADPRPAGLNLVDYMPQVRDFADTAALVQHLDLVISVDTSVAHLAGALARPVWMPIVFQSEYRWMLNRTDTPWYPTMRIFRQSAIGDWQTPIRQIAEELRSL